MTFQIAKREAVPLIISLAGTSGSGKTYSALLLAAGIAGENGKVGFIDTEAGRGSMYADDEEIKSVLPNGQYYVKKLTEPFSPSKYVTAIKDAIKNKIDVLIIDSASHAWEGFGGCCDIAENNKTRGMPNWAKAKMEHKKLMNLLTQCPMHIIFCLRAREKIKIVKNPNTGKAEIEQIGLQPIQEKNFMYEMTLAMLLDDDKNPGKPRLTKCPKPLLHIFSGDNPIITKEIGEKLKAWSDGGENIDKQLRNFKRECREYAICGSDSLDIFLKENKESKKELINKISTDLRTELRALAKQADIVQLNHDEENEPINKLNLTK